MVGCTESGPHFVGSQKQDFHSTSDASACAENVGITISRDDQALLSKAAFAVILSTL